MTTPHKPAEDIAMRDVVKTRQATEFQLKLRKDRLISFDQHPALTALKRLAGEFRHDASIHKEHGDRAREKNKKQETRLQYAFQIQLEECAARLEQAIKEVEG